MTITRREMLGLLSWTGAMAALPGCAAGSLFLRPDSVAEAIRSQPFGGLVTSLPVEHDYLAEIEGKLPTTLRGALYRNGPGLFERNNIRKRSLLDGDGMVRVFAFGERQVRFISRFVKTDRYLKESKAGSYLFPSYSALAQEAAPRAVSPGESTFGQAQVSVFVWNGKLFAFDESSPPYELDPVTLEAMGQVSFGLQVGLAAFGSRPKFDPRSGEWIHFGIRYVQDPNLHVTVLGADGSLASHRSFSMPASVMIHDFFMTEQNLVFHLHPLEIDIDRFLSARSPLMDCLRWRPSRGSTMMVIPRRGTSSPLMIRTGALFMWHAVNAFDEEDTIVADFIGYNAPDRFIGPDAPLQAVMEGKTGSFVSSGEYRRIRIEPASGKITGETLGQTGYEWPAINPVHCGVRHRYAYISRTRPGEFFSSGITRLDTATGTAEDFFFGPGMYCGEPVFAPLPGINYQLRSDTEPGYLMTEAYDSARGKSLLAVFRSDRLKDGPVVRILLRHHLPYGLHGSWLPLP